ncbi:hypothetical protein ANCCAN_18473 [Ancylostoma caninum]|uniref:Uncharacterized protein n=1 Tax=Ancylostoma caninum TaxID=29170 RepID=A0A368FW16_ANCCA|nr:hypothetical protein ANCCAN_18473 [Ancylostoma caninum]
MNTLRNTKKSRASPIPLHVSDYIVKEVLKHEKILIQGGSTRMLFLNEERRQLWHQISVKVFTKFEVSLTPSQVQVHFNNRKKRVLGIHPLEKGYRLYVGSGKQLDVDTTEPVVHFQGADLDIYNYFRSRESQQANSPAGEICDQNHKGGGPSPLFEAPVSSDSSECSVSVEYAHFDKERNGSCMRKRRVENADAVASSSDEDEYLETLNSHHVSKLHLRRLKAKMLKKQMKLFDGLTNMVAVQTKTLETLLDVAKSIRVEFDHMRKAPSTMNHAPVNYRPRTPSDLSQEAVRNPPVVPKCEGNSFSLH